MLGIEVKIIDTSNRSFPTSGEPTKQRTWPKFFPTQEELEILQTEKARLEGELKGAEKDQTRLEKKLEETEQKFQSNQKTDT